MYRLMQKESLSIITGAPLAVCAGVCFCREPAALCLDFSSYVALRGGLLGFSQTAFGPHVGAKPPADNSTQAVQPVQVVKYRRCVTPPRLVILRHKSPHTKRPYLTMITGCVVFMVFPPCSSLCCESSYDQYVSVV